MEAGMSKRRAQTDKHPERESGNALFFIEQGKGGLKEIACWRVLETQRAQNR